MGVAPLDAHHDSVLRCRHECLIWQRVQREHALVRGDKDAWTRTAFIDRAGGGGARAHFRTAADCRIIPQVTCVRAASPPLTLSSITTTPPSPFGSPGVQDEAPDLLSHRCAPPPPLARPGPDRLRQPLPLQRRVVRERRRRRSQPCRLHRCASVSSIETSCSPERRCECAIAP